MNGPVQHPQSPALQARDRFLLVGTLSVGVEQHPEPVHVEHVGLGWRRRFRADRAHDAAHQREPAGGRNKISKKIQPTSKRQRVVVRKEIARIKYKNGRKKKTKPTKFKSIRGIIYGFIVRVRGKKKKKKKRSFLSRAGDFNERIRCNFFFIFFQFIISLIPVIRTRVHVFYGARDRTDRTFKIHRRSRRTVRYYRDDSTCS